MNAYGVTVITWKENDAVLVNSEQELPAISSLKAIRYVLFVLLVSNRFEKENDSEWL